MFHLQSANFTPSFQTHVSCVECGRYESSDACSFAECIHIAYMASAFCTNRYSIRFMLGIAPWKSVKRLSTKSHRLPQCSFFTIVVSKSLRFTISWNFSVTWYISMLVYFSCQISPISDAKSNYKKSHSFKREEKKKMLKTWMIYTKLLSSLEIVVFFLLLLVIYTSTGYVMPVVFKCYQHQPFFQEVLVYKRPQYITVITV